jgi:hypothetical protein
MDLLGRLLDKGAASAQAPGAAPAERD